MATNFKIKASTELMYNYKQFELFDQKGSFKAVQTEDGHSLFFGKSTDNQLYLIHEKSGTRTGWEKINLMRGLSGILKTFSVSQNRDTGVISIAIAMGDPTGVDKLYLCMNLSGSDLSWTKDVLPWSYKADDRVGTANPNLIIDDMHISQSNTDEVFVIVDTNGTNGFIDRYWINLQGGPTWNKHALSFNLANNSTDKSLLGRKTKEMVDGIYTLGEENNVVQFVYTPIYNPFDPTSAPNPTNLDLAATGLTAANGSFAICAALSGEENETDVFVGGNGALYYLSAADQKQAARPQRILQNDILTTVRDLQASKHKNKVVVWGLNESDEVFYLSCDIANVLDTTAWTIPLPLLSGVSEISQYINRVAGGITIFGLSSSGFIQKGVQDPDTFKWKFSKIELPTVNVHAQAAKEKSYTTSVKVTDENNNPLPHVEVTLTPSGHTNVYINNLYYVLSGKPITVKTDASGVLFIIEWIDGLVGTSFEIAIGAQANSVDPSNIPMNKMKDLGSVQALENARITNADGSTRSLLPTGLSEDSKKALAQSISNLNQAHASIVSSPGSRSTAMAVPAAAVSPVHYIKVLWGDLIQGIKHFGEYVVKLVKDTANNVWHFVVNIGDKVYGFIIDTVEKVAGALKSIWEKIAKGFEDLWDYIKYLFEWQDILLTRDVYKQTVKIFLHRIGEDLQDIKASLDNSIIDTETLIKQWADPVTEHPPLGDNNSAVGSMLKDKESNPATHSAPSELLKNHFIGNVQRSEITEKPSSASSDPTWSGLTDLSEFIESEQANIDDLRQQIKNLFISASSQQQDPDLEKIVKKIIADIAVAALDLFKLAADKILDFLTLLIYEAIDLLDAPMYIPILSDILKDVFNISTPSLLDILCLIGAVPATIVYKVVNGHAPYESGDNTIHDKITKATTYAELQANFQQNDDKITLDKDAEAAIFETFYLLSGISTIINGVLVVLDEEVDGSASTVLSTPKTVTSLLASATVGMASLFKIPIGIKNNTMNTFSSVLSKIGIVVSLGFAVAPKVIAKVKGITETGPLAAMKTQVNLVKTGVGAVLAFIGLVPQTYHIIEIIADGEAATPHGALGILDSTQKITKDLGAVVGFAALVDSEEISKQVLIIVQGVLVAVTGGIQLEEAAVEAITNRA